MPQISSSQLQVNQPIDVAAPDATLVINNDPARPLGVGTHVFQLEVVDNSGNRSQPAQLRVVVLDNQAPTAIITGPDRVPFGQPITLSAARSVDVGGGSVVRFIWTLIQ